MKKMKNVPALRFPEFDKALTSKVLGTMGTFRGGGTPDSFQSAYWEGEIPWISSSDVSEGDIRNIKLDRFITEEALKNSATKLIPEDSILFISRVGIGKLAISDRPLTTSQDFTNLTLLEDNPQYLGYYFQANRNALYRLAQGTSIKGFTSADLKILRVTVSGSFQEQTKIAIFLAAVDNKVKQLQKKKSILEQYKKGVMQQIFNQEIRLKDSDGKDYPDWEKKKLKDICTNIRSGTIKPGVQGEYPVYGSTGVIGKSASFSHSGTFILIARVGANAGTVNIASGDFSVTDNALIIECCSPISTVFIYYYLIKLHLARLVFGSGQPLITGGQLKRLDISVPVSEEQVKIANFLSAIDEKINHVNHQLEKTKQFKKGLLQQMFV